MILDPSAETPDHLIEQLRSLRTQIAALAPAQAVGLRGIRDALEQAAVDAETADADALAPLLRRVALLTEVWECLALEGSDETGAVAAFCVDTLGRLSAESADPEPERMLEESALRWGDYLQLLDPQSLSGSETDDALAGDPAPVDDPPEPALDPSLLLRLLGAPPASDDETEDDPAPPISEPPPVSRLADPQQPRANEYRPSTNGTGAHADPSSQDGSREKPNLARPEPSRSVAHRHDSSTTPAEGSGRTPQSPDRGGAQAIAASIARLDSELRAAFVAEATDLFERIEAILVHLEREPTSAPLLHELGRCLHTLKGSAGSIGLAEFAAQVHAIEDALEGTPNGSPQSWMRQLDALLAAFESAGTSRAPAASSFPAATQTTVKAPLYDEGSAPAASTESLLRIPTERIEALMDLVSELIVRRGVWSAQVETMKDFADSVRAIRARLLGCAERLDGLRPDPRGELGRLTRGLTEQADDLALLAQNVQASTVPLSDDGDALTRISLQLWEQLQAVQIVPIRGLFHRLVRVARDAARVEDREIEVRMVGEDTGLDRAVQDKAFEPLLHIVRNAVGHGIEGPAERVAAGKCPIGCITLESRREGNTLVIAVKDDGRGLDDAAILDKGRRAGLIQPHEVPSPDRLRALIFHSGFSTRTVANEVSGRGVGMDVVAQEVRRLRGTIHLSSQPGQGTTITIRLPTRLAVERVLITRVGGQVFGIPVAMVEYAEPFNPAACTGEANRQTVVVGDRTVPVLDARNALGICGAPREACPKLLVVRADEGTLGLVVDSIEGARELVIKPLGPLLAGHPMIAGTSVLMTGEVILVLNPLPLSRQLGSAGHAAPAVLNTPAAPSPLGALIVDDSLSVRRVVARQLRALGFNVDEVSDGLEALHRLKAHPYRLVLTDLEMPRMDGFELLAELGRLNVQPASPVIVVSTLSDPQTRQRVHALGASAFVPKPIEPNELARAVRGLVPVQV